MNCWFHLCFVFSICPAMTHETGTSTTRTVPGNTSAKIKKCSTKDAEIFMGEVNTRLTNRKSQSSQDWKDIGELEKVLESTNVTSTTSISSGHLVALLHQAKSPTRLTIYANNSEVYFETVPNTKVLVHLPKDLGAGPNNTIVFCMITWPETNGTVLGAQGLLYENILVGLSVSGKNVSGLQERVNITMNVTTPINETHEPRCVFLNFSTQNYGSEGCQTLWERNQTYITCSCDHLTYFGVLMVNSSPSPSDQKILSYITLIGCSLSLFGLSITVLLFITHKKFRADVSMKVHISLVFALILLNVHFLPSEMVAALSSNSLCVYMALALHYSLLATFSWMALEGFHLYLLLVRVFNIYIRRYLLKLSVVGWGVPAVIVSLVVIIDRTAYGYTPVDSRNPNGTAICYVTNTTMMMVTTMGMIGLVFIFNVIMLGVTVRRFISLRQGQETNCSRVKQDIFSLLGIATLLGITWGVGFFSITTAGQYVFCILNSLQGFFIFLWFVMSLRKMQKSAAEVSNATQSTTEPKN
ncbi:adhesion G-protein coupled receptor G2-like isoform X2 [Betta splendens]|uniref:Adhesion G-protein coupled receptor G2-like isoform X2 n=1 Tax=Betta splendens TaxID=158456 RepID=A0A9W2XN56_BETSP|nr:adhesion G-protein coupled receptor G2-like isoform X2 [Betta splendens]